jgi:hypothetical protein
MICIGQEESKEEKTYPIRPNERILKELELVKNMSPEEYETKMDKYRSSIQKFIEHKKGVCSGDFSTIVLNEDGITKEEERKLSWGERKVCIREIKQLQITFINNLYTARKKYLEYLHYMRIKELTSVRDESIKSIQKRML